RLVKFFLIIYFMVLAVVPCNDIHAQSPNNSKDSYSTISNSEDSHSKDKGDICSPLCTCNCCQITVASFKSEPLPLQKKVTEYFSKKIHFQKNDFAYLVYDQIWQPPKI
ncbi:DUF6660 family protein, partial [Chryseobacterium joostei]